MVLYDTSPAISCITRGDNPLQTLPLAHARPPFPELLS